MTPTDSANAATAVLIVTLVWLLVGIAVYVWYAWMLSRVFVRLGTDGWRAWVPVLNEMTIYERGGVPAWNVVFYFIPVVNLYALYLKFVAVERINPRFGKGTGLSVVAILAAPVWATLLVLSKSADAGVAPVHEGEAVAHRAVHGGLADSDHAVQPPAPPTPALGPVGSDSDGAAPAAALAAESWPDPAPLQAAGPESLPPSQPAVHAPAASPAEGVSVAETVAAPAPAPVSEPAPASAPTSEPIVVHNPWARPATSTPTSASAPDASGVEVPSWLGEVEPAAATAPPVDAPALQAPEATSAAAATPPAAAPAVAPEAAPAVSSAPPAPLDEDDDYGETVVVDRRPRVSWNLNVDGGEPLALTSSRVVLGRRPAPTEPGTQTLAVPDATRTLSKSHARLELTDGAWTIVDLNSTNGVLLVGDDGEETLAEPGQAVPVPDRFILGKLGMSISYEAADA